MFRLVRFVLVSALVLSGCLTLAEVGRRVLDGYRVWSVDLVKDPGSTDLTWSTGRSTEGLLSTITADVDADPAWFYDRPQPVPRTPPEWAEKRRIAFGDEANYVWNASRVRHPEFKKNIQKNRPAAPVDIFTFRPPDGDGYPLYRFYPGIETGLGLSNQFGWRGREISAEKPPDVIRIGALGDSTTGAYPAMVEHWLNLWAVRRSLGVRFEVVNAARPAAGALDAAAIFEFELGTVDPDYVIIYGFGNGIQSADALIALPSGLMKGRPAPAAATQAGFVARASRRVDARVEPWARRSAAARFLRGRLLGQQTGTGSSEPAKPVTRVAFPAGIDERAPDVGTIASHSGAGLMELEACLRGLDKIDAIAKSRQTRVFVSTFRVMAVDGMLLGQGDANLYKALNEDWWPYTYAQIRRLTTFYNRTLRAWAGAKGADIIPVNEEMPWQADLYGDGIHEVLAGEALHAWIVLQHLMPSIRDDLAHHRLPRQARHPGRDTEQYWKIVRTSLEDAVAGAPPEPAADVADAFPLSTITLANPNAEIVRGDVPLIRTATEPSGYAASVALAPSTAAGLRGSGWISVRARVKEGRITVGVLDKTGLKFLAYSSLDSAPDIQTAQLAIDDLSVVGRVMISNNRTGEGARSLAELHSVELKRFSPVSR